MKSYRAAIVGCGRIASLFAEDTKRKGISTHAQAYLKHPRTKLVAACDRDKGRLLAFGKRWGIKKLYSSLEELLKKEKIDILSICTPNQTHAMLAEQAVQHGVKGIVCEKPIADSLHHADHLIETCRKQGVPLLINHIRRYVPLYHRIYQMIHKGELGKIQGISCYYSAGVLNTGTHLFDILNHFFGEVAWVWADPSHVLGTTDRTYNGYLFFKRGFGCSLTAVEVAPYLMFEVDIYGSKKRVRLTNSGSEAQIWRSVKSPQFTGYRSLELHKTLKGSFDRGFINLVSSAVDLVEKKKPIYCSGEHGRANLEIAVALHESAKQGGQRVELPLKQRRLSLQSK